MATKGKAPKSQLHSAIWTSAKLWIYIVYGAQPVNIGDVVTYVQKDGTVETREVLAVLGTGSAGEKSPHAAPGTPFTRVVLKPEYRERQKAQKKVTLRDVMAELEALKAARK